MRHSALVLCTAVATLATMTTMTGANATVAITPVSNPAALVNPLIGTGTEIPPAPSGGVNTFPGPDVPFGMLQWSPDTSPDRQMGGGYYYGDSQILGYSLTHIDGPGCAVAGDVPILPMTGAIPSSPSSVLATFSHADEVASADYYSVVAGGIKTELTETLRSGIGRFTFPATTQAHLLLKLADSEKPVQAVSATEVSPTEVQGSVTTGGFCSAQNRYTLYFDLTFDHSITGTGTWTGTTLMPRVRRLSASALTGPAGMYLTFDTTTSQVLQAKVGISYVSAADAAQNARTDQPGWDFASVHQAGVSAWNSVLGKIQIGGGSTSRQAVFYTALYHSLLHPNVFSDVNGDYIGFDGQVHTVTSGHIQVANFSAWDTYRSQAQLEALVDPAMASNAAQSLVNDAAQNNGMLPKWALNNSETYVMVGDPADGLLGGYYAFGARNFDTASALKYALADAYTPSNVRPGLSYYESLGYLPVDGTYGCCNFKGAVSTTLEYAASDYALSNFARALGDSTDAAKLLARSQNWENLYNPATGYLQPRLRSGAWVPVTATTQTNYVEGDASQYRWQVGWNLRGLFNAMGGDAAVNTSLGNFWVGLNNGPASPFTYWDNEFEFYDPWEYDFTSEPWKTQALVAAIRSKLYLDAPSGEGGNDDLGETASMGVFTMLGFDPLYVSTADVAVNSPCFPLEIIHLASGHTLTINAPAASASNIYLNSMTVNGTAWAKTWLPASLFTNGASITVGLASVPDTGWGTASSDAPPSYGTGEQPAIGFLPAGQVSVAPGASVAVRVGVQDVAGRVQSVGVGLTAPSGLTATPSSGTISVPSHGRGYLDVTISAASGMSPGTYQIPITLTETGATFPPLHLTVVVT